MKRKVCVVTGTRADYGLLRWLMAGASVDGCTLYAFGGSLPGGVAAPDVDQYNPVTNLWSARAPMPEGL